MDIQQIKSDFDHDGFVILRNFLSEAEVQEFRERGGASVRVSPKPRCL